MRLFAAVVPPAGVAREAAGWIERLAAEAAAGRGVRWVRPEAIHLTLHFFGEVPEGERERVEAALAAGVAGAPGAFDVSLDGLGAFPTPARARVIWLGATGVGAERLVRLQAAVAGAVSAAGFPVDARPFHPHLTLGRVEGRPPAALARAVEAGAGRRLGEFRVDAVTLVKSEPARGGSRYTPLARWTL